MSGPNDHPSTWLRKVRAKGAKQRAVGPGTAGDLMKQIAALYAQAANLRRDGVPLKKLSAERQKLERQAAELNRRLMAL